MNERIKELRKALGITQQAFADSVGLKRQTVAAYETGNIKPSDSTLLLICKEFNVNEEWLRTGEGEIFYEKSRNQLILEFVGEIIKEPDSFQARVFQALAKLEEKDWEEAKKLLYKLAKKL